MEALVRCVLGVVRVDVEADEIVEVDAAEELPLPQPPDVRLPRLVAADAVGAMVVAVVDRRPPLLVSHDSATTWREAGAGLPPGRAVAISADDPDLILFAGEERLFVSRDGGRFWQALAVELAGISAVCFNTGESHRDR